jgi:hypothetical protein
MAFAEVAGNHEQRHGMTVIGGCKLKLNIRFKKSLFLLPVFAILTAHEQVAVD